MIDALIFRLVLILSFVLGGLNSPSYAASHCKKTSKPSPSLFQNLRIAPRADHLEVFQNFPTQNRARESYTHDLFIRAGVPPEHIERQGVARGFSNILIQKPGTSKRTILISAHHDVLGRGSHGIIDNAAAILALRDLYLALQDKTTRHTFVFAIFALEEVGYPAGSQKYVASLTDEQLSTIDAMIALECLAVNGNATWDNAPRHLLTLFHQTAEDMGTRIIKIPAPGPLGPYNDSQPFLKRRVPAISLFGTTTQEVASQINRKKFKVFFLDIGLSQRILGLNLAEEFLKTKNMLARRGGLAEQFVAQEWISRTKKNETPGLFYWHRENRSSQAEVDFLIQAGSTILPVKVKSGTGGSLKSLHLFLEEKKAFVQRGLKISSDNFSSQEKIRSIPFYALLQWGTEKYRK